MLSVLVFVCVACAGYTPCHGAGFQGRLEVMRALRAAKLNVLDVHTDGFTPFHRACWGKTDRHAELVEAMVNF